MKSKTSVFFKLFDFKNPLSLSVLSGLLLILAWPMSRLTILIFIAWVPLLVLSDLEDRIRFFLHSFLAMLLWNVGTTWWIWNSTAAGAIGAIIANSFLMCIPLWGYHIIKTNIGRKAGNLSFITFWLGFEYIHLNWQLSWPWLTLGNVFATHPNWVQWYEVTGTSGGSFWILLVNLLLYNVFRSRKKEERFDTKNNKRHVAFAILLLLLPIAISYLQLLQLNKKDSVKTGEVSSNIVIVQPNIDPYNEKFIAGNTDAIIQKMITQSENALDSNTRLVIWPETAVPVGVWQDQVEQNLYYRPIFDFVYRHPKLTLVSGVETYKNYGFEKATNTARKNESEGTYYDAFNASIAITANQPVQFYNKSKLVPGVETLPDFMMWLGAIFEHFGGTTGGYGKDKESSVFSMPGNPYKVAPIICYESIYGEYIASYVRKGANLLTIMTNDGWWANTAGHKQHLHYARLHAIETRKWIARSANTGISAVIDNKGQLLETRSWDETSTIKYNIPALTGETFFVQHGDLISPVACVIMIILIGWNVYLVVVKRINKRKSKNVSVKS